ncbi:MAG TPA: hemolysin family protein [Actinomycetota bacterium]|nr:hemolysin family protein [Actinomycetota bacterium]
MTGWYLLIALGLLAANGFFVGAEFAVIAARRTKIDGLAASGDVKARLAQKSIKELSFVLAGVQLGITMASLGLGAVAEPAVAHLIESALHSVVDLSEGLLHSISFVIALTIVVFFHMVIGEMAPKNVAIAEPEKSALWLALPLRIYANVFRPVIRGLNMIANVGTRLFGVEPQEERTEVHTAGELRAMIADSAREGMVDAFEHRLLSGAIGFGTRDAASIMVPRTEMVAVPATITPSELEGFVLATGHSRFPVYAGDLDNVVGFVHAKDLLKMPVGGREQPLERKWIRQMLVVPESLRLHPLLVDMRRERHQFALVVDEHGGTAGIVTLEDLLEELVGEIRDEYDFSEAGVEQLSERRFLVPGSYPIYEAGERLGVHLPPGEYETVAGFIMGRLGRIPRRRDVVEHEGWRLRVRAMHRRRVVQVLIEEAEPEEAPPGPR